MMLGFCKRLMLVAALSTLVFVAGAGADDIRLPDMGSPADAVLSKNAEAQIGAAIMREIRRSGVLVEDGVAYAARWSRPTALDPFVFTDVAKRYDERVIFRSVSGAAEPGEVLATRAPTFGTKSTKFRSAKRRSASRTGPRLTLNRDAMAVSLNFSPGLS